MNLDQHIQPHSRIGQLGCGMGDLPVSGMPHKEGLHIGQDCFLVYKDARGATNAEQALGENMVISITVY
jgi:hypothetical protein